MIIGTVLEELEPYKKYRVRVYNNKPFRDDKYEGLLELYEKTFEQQGQIQYEYDELNADARIAAIEDEISQLEEIGGLKAAYDIQNLVTEIQQIETARWIIRERFEEVSKNQLNVENELKTKIYRSEEYWDYDCYCAAYEKHTVGGAVGVVCDGYNTSEAVILPKYFRKGYGTHLTSQELFDNWTWFFYHVMQLPLHRDYATHYKAKITKRHENETFNIIMETFEGEAPNINYTNVPSVYIEGSENPYFVNDEVLVYIEKNEDGVRVPKIIGFWQEPRRPFYYETFDKTFKQGYVLEGSEREGYKYKIDWGSAYYYTLPDTDVFSRLSGYSSINNFEDETLFMGYLLSRRRSGGALLDTGHPLADENSYYAARTIDFDGRNKPVGFINDFKHPENLNEPFELRPIRSSGIRSIDEAPYLCNGKYYTRYLYIQWESDDRRILFNPQYRGWTNYIYKLEDGYAYLRNGGCLIGEDEENHTVLVNFNDGRGNLKRQWLDTEVQQLYNDICYHNQMMIDAQENPDEVYLYNRMTGQHFDNFKDYYDSQLQTNVFFGTDGAYKNETEKRVRFFDLPNISGLYNAVNSRNQTPQGGVPNIKDHRVFFTGNYNAPNYPSNDPEVISYISNRCNPYRYFDFKIEDNMFIRAGTIPGQINDIVVMNNRSQYSEYNTGQSFGYVYNYTKTYKYIHDFDYREIKYIEV